MSNTVEQWNCPCPCFLPQSKKHDGSKLPRGVRVNSCLSLCVSPATCPGCAPPLTQWQRGSVPAPSWSKTRSAVNWVEDGSAQFVEHILWLNLWPPPECMIGVWFLDDLYRVNRNIAPVLWFFFIVILTCKLPPLIWVAVSAALPYYLKYFLRHEGFHLFLKNLRFGLLFL